MISENCDDFYETSLILEPRKTKNNSSPDLGSSGKGGAGGGGGGSGGGGLGGSGGGGSLFSLMSPRGEDFMKGKKTGKGKPPKRPKGKVPEIAEDTATVPDMGV